MVPVIFLCAWLFLASVADAATYYVATNGNNSNDGLSIDTPKLTIAHCVSIMVAGDTCLVRGGTYSESGGIRFAVSGTSSAPILLKNYPGEGPIISFPSKTSSNRILIQHASGPNVAIGWITIEGFEIRNGWEGIKFSCMHNSTIRRNWIHDGFASGILGTGGHHNVFERNIINHQGDFEGCAAGTALCNQQHGLYMHGDSYTITNNVIYDNIGVGIQQNGSSTSTYSTARHPSPDFAGAANWIISDNTLAYNQHGAGIVIWGNNSNNIRIENNICYENQVNSGTSSGQCVFFTSVSAAINVLIRNNHSFASGSGGQPFIGGSATEGVQYTLSGNVVNVSAPAFVDGGSNVLPPAPDFTLTASAPVNIARVNEFPNNSTLVVGAFKTIAPPTASITTNKLTVTFAMATNTPLQVSGTPGWSITCTPNPTACPGSPTIISVSRREGTDSLVDVEIGGIPSNTCAAGQDWKVSYDASGSVQDSALIGPMTMFFNQFVFSFSNILATNNCNAGPPAFPSGSHVWLKFDGNHTDASGNNLHGTPTGSPIFVASKLNQGMQLRAGEVVRSTVPYGNGVNMDTQDLTIIGGIDVAASDVSLSKIYAGVPFVAGQRLYLSTGGGTWRIGVGTFNDGTATEFAVQSGHNRICIRANASTNTVTLTVNGVTGTSAGAVRTHAGFLLPGDFSFGLPPSHGTNGAAGVLDDWKIYTSLVSCQDDYAAWNASVPAWAGTLSVAASRWYGAKTVEAARVPLAANNTVADIASTGAATACYQTDCTGSDCSQISQRLYYTCATCPSAGSELPMPDVPTTDGIFFYGDTQELGLLSGDHGDRLTGALTRLTGTTNHTSSSIPVFDLAQNETVVQCYILKCENCTAGREYKVYPKEQSGLPLNGMTPSGGLPLRIVSPNSNMGH